MTENYFQAKEGHPQHISVGGVLINEKGEVCCHHLLQKDDPTGYWKDQGFDDVYILMRETLEPHERLEDALMRGLKEEFGAEGDILDYLGSLREVFDHKDGEPMEKTTLYFLVRCTSQNEADRSPEVDIEGRTTLEWHTPEFLIEKMRSQREQYKRGDVDEGDILEKLSTRAVS